MSFTFIIEKLVNRENLSSDEAIYAMESIAKGEQLSVEVAAFLVLLRSKGETSDEVAGLVKVMRNYATAIHADGPLLDIVGTGGDGHDTINISTSAAVLAAACGARVCKHGNRSVSSKSGSADVLEKLGVKMLKAEHIVPCISETGIAFMYAPFFHPAMKHVVPVRKGLKVRTVFNILGPLLNPAGAQHLFLGVYSPDLLEIYGQTLLSVGVQHALVVHCCGLDELAPLGVAKAVEVTPAGLKHMEIDTLSFGIPKCNISDLKGGDAEFNATAITNIFNGGDAAKTPTADTIALNAGAGLYVYGLADSIKSGYLKAKEVLLSGNAADTLKKWARVSTELENGVKKQRLA